MSLPREKLKLANFSRKQKAEEKLIEDEEFNEFAHTTAVRSCLPELPKLPKYFQNQLATNELEEVNDPDSFTLEQSIWSVWNFYHRLKVATLFIYKFIDNPTVAALYNEFPELEINTRIARKIFNLPTVFFPASASQTAAIIFADPLKDFFLQYIVTSYICMEQFAQEIERVFTQDENNILTAPDLELLRKFIRKLNGSFKLIEKAIEKIKNENVLLFADTYDYEDENTFYLRIFREFEESNSLATYLNTATTSDKIWDEYDKEIEAIDDDSSFEKCAVEAKLNLELEEFFYGLLISEMSIFHTVKNAIVLPGVIDEEITLYLKSYDAKKNIEEKKDTEQIASKQKEIIEKFVINSDLVSYINHIKEISEDDERIRCCRDFYYEIRDTLAVIFYIFKNIVEENPIKRNQQVREIVNSINELQRQINNKQSVKPVLEAEMPAVSAQPKPAHFPRKRQRISKTKEKGVTQQVQASVAIVNDKAKDATPPDPKAELNERYQAGLKIQEELETKAGEFLSEFGRIFIALGAISKFDKLDKELKGLKGRFKTEFENVKNMLKGQAKIDFKDFDKAKYSEDLQKKLIKWEMGLKKLLETIIGQLKKMNDINDSLIGLTAPRFKVKKFEEPRRRNSEKSIKEPTQVLPKPGLVRSVSDNGPSPSTVKLRELEVLERLFQRKMGPEEKHPALNKSQSQTNVPAASIQPITPKSLNSSLTSPTHSIDDDNQFAAASIVPGFLKKEKVVLNRSLSEADASAISVDPYLLATERDDVSSTPAQSNNESLLAGSRSLFFSQSRIENDCAAEAVIFQLDTKATDSQPSKKRDILVELSNLQLEAKLEFESEIFDEYDVYEALAELANEEARLREDKRDAEELLEIAASTRMSEIDEPVVELTSRIQSRFFGDPQSIKSNDWKSPVESSQNPDEFEVSRLWNQPQ